MTTAVESWSEVPQAAFDAALARVSSLAVERFPDLETRTGAIADLVMTLQASILAATEITAARRASANTIAALAADPANADAAVAARLLSNYGVSPAAAAAASGIVLVTLSRPVPLVIPTGTVFAAGANRTFRTEVGFAGRLTAGEVTTDSDRLLVLQPDGSATMTIDVVAEQTGAASLLRQGDLLTPDRVLPNVTRAQAASDFSGGRDAETLADVVARLEIGVAARGWSTAAGVAALVRQHPSFGSAAVSVVGAGQPEQHRDRHGIIPISAGNRLDLWVRQPERLATKTIEIGAKYVAGQGGAAQWVIDIPRALLSGAARIVNIVRPGRVVSAAVLTWTTTLRYAAEPGDPDIVTGLETANSAFQTLRLEFADLPGNEALIANVTTVPYQVTAQVLTDLGALQTWLATSDNAPLFGDVVVRAAVPCRVALRVELTRLGVDVPTGDLSAALAAYINRGGFPGRLYSSELAAIIDQKLPGDVHVRRVRMTGFVYAPGGRRIVLQNDAVLDAPQEPAEYVTPRTVAFSSDPADVTFEVIP